MAKHDSDTSHFMKLQLAWLVGSLAISIGLSFVLPFPISIVVAITLFISVSLLIRYRIMRKTGMSGGIMSGWSKESTKIAARCIRCNHKHKQRACPKCGSLGVSYH